MPYVESSRNLRFHSSSVLYFFDYEYDNVYLPSHVDHQPFYHARRPPTRPVSPFFSLSLQGLFHPCDHDTIHSLRGGSLYSAPGNLFACEYLNAPVLGLKMLYSFSRHVFACARLVAVILEYPSLPRITLLSISRAAFVLYTPPHLSCLAPASCLSRLTLFPQPIIVVSYFSLCLKIDSDCHDLDSEPPIALQASSPFGGSDITICCGEGQRTSIESK